MTRLSNIVGVEFTPARAREKFVAGLGGFVAILSILLVTDSVLDLADAELMVASMGASAVLLFAVPHGQLSQPWPVIAGHGCSALIGVACAKWISSPMLAAACAVGIAITVMHALRCIHPPGGATALTAVTGSQALHDLGFRYVFVPVLLNAVLIVSVAVVFNLAFEWRRYPSALANAPRADDSSDAVPTHEEIVDALRGIDSFVDISEDDLLHLIEALRTDELVTRFTARP